MMRLNKSETFRSGRILKTKILTIICEGTTIELVIIAIYISRRFEETSMSKVGVQHPFHLHSIRRTPIPGPLYTFVRASVLLKKSSTLQQTDHDESSTQSRHRNRSGGCEAVRIGR